MVIEMALLKYLKDGLPNPKGSLSSAIPPRAIAQMNHDVLTHAYVKYHTFKFLCYF